MIVISTIRASDIDASNAKNKGAQHLKDFLFFAEHASTSERVLPPSSAESVAMFLKRDIESMGKGYQVDLNVGNSEFKVSLGIKEEGASKYLLGIILDDTPPSPNISCRDRFYVEGAMLAGLHWKLCRVYTIQYLRSKRSVLRRLENALAKIEEEPDEAPTFIPPNLRSANAVFDYQTSPYKKYRLLPEDHIDYADVRADYFDPRVESTLRHILQNDSPLSSDSIKEYMKEAFSIQQMGSKAQKVVVDHLRRIPEIVKTEDLDGKRFYWYSEDGEIKVTSFRKIGLDIDRVAKEEIIFLANKIVESQGEIGREPLIRLTSEHLGIGVIGPKARRKLEFAFDYAEANNLFINGYLK